MKFLGLVVLVLSLNVFAKDKDAGFSEVLSSDETPTESVKDSETAKKDEEPKVILKENEEVLSGTVRVIRRINDTEVFFKDLKDSYIIQSGSNYSSIFKALDNSQKKGTAVSFKANTKSRRILSLESASTKSAPATSSSDGSAKSGNK